LNEIFFFEKKFSLDFDAGILPYLRLALQGR
jgi:hypothetical protein